MILQKCCFRNHHGITKATIMCGVFQFFSEDITWIDDARNVGDCNIPSNMAFADNISAKADVCDAFGGTGGRPIDTCLIIIVDDCALIS